MKVFHVLRSSNVGGATEHLKLLLEGTRKTLDNYVFACPGDEFSSFKKLCGKNRVFSLTSRVLGNNSLIRKEVERIRPDIVHMHGRGASIDVRVSERYPFKPRFVYTLHGFHIEGDNVLARMLYSHFENRHYSFVDRFIHVSESEKEAFRGIIKHYDEGKHVVIPNAVKHLPEENYYTSEEVGNTISIPEVKKLLLDKDCIKFICIARLSYAKGVDILIEAFSRFLMESKRKAFLVIVGDGPERNSCEKLIAKLELTGKVFLAGKIDNARRLLKAFDAFVLTSRWEGMPLTILEALDAGLPVIATDVPGIRDLPDHTRLTRYPPNKLSINKAMLKYTTFAGIPENGFRSFTGFATIQKEKAIDDFLDEITKAYRNIA
jgi:glycosyltransferase involved in cell wall biosynthesis